MTTTLPNTPAITSAPAVGLVARHTVGERLVQACLLANVVGAGAPGAVLLLSPGSVAEYAGGDASVQVARLVGCLWFAIGVMSLLGLHRPGPLRTLLAVQVLYKSIYVAAVGIPMITAGRATPTVVGLTIGFAVIVVAWSLALRASRAR